MEFPPLTISVINFNLEEIELMIINANSWSIICTILLSFYFNFGASFATAPVSDAVLSIPQFAAADFPRYGAVVI